MKARVTRAQVLMLMKSQAVRSLRQPITTHRMAYYLETGEPSVRAAAMWLCRAGYLAKFCHFIKEPRGKKYEQEYKVWAYLWTGKTDPLHSVRRNSEERAIQMAAMDAEKVGANLQDLLNSMSRARCN